MTDKFEPGSIRSVRMVNFMKHSNLCIELKPHVNFITGRNGSGKSSILVALSVGLGCNSRVSGRGNKLEELIKDGQNKAIITITIQNGPDGYNYETYGNTITVIRSITRTTSHFEIEGFKKNQSTSIREELERIRSFFNIQIDNPCSIMHQDTAREFIASSSPTRKYELFMKGTLLSHLIEEIKNIKVNIEKVESQKLQRLEEKTELDREFEKQERKYQIVKEADGIHQRIHDLEDELVWSHYRVAYQAVQDVQTKIDDIKQKIQEKDVVIEEKRRKKEEAQKLYDENKKEYDENMAKIQEIRNKIQQLGTRLAPIKAELHQQKSQLTHRQNSVQMIEKDLQRKGSDLARMEAQRERELQDAQNRRKKFIEQRQTELQNIEVQLPSLDSEIDSLSAQISSLSNQEAQAGAACREYESRLNNVKGKLEVLKKASSSDDKSSNVDNSNRYDFKPFGPLSNYIHMKDNMSKWALAAQHIVGKALDVYVVHSRNDEQQFRRTNPTATIIQSSFTNPRYDIGNPRPPCDGAQRIIDVLSFKDEEIQGVVNRTRTKSHTGDIIYNVLIDIYSADRTWCIEDERMAKEAAYSGRVPSTITTSGVQFKIQSGFEVMLGAKNMQIRIGEDTSARMIQLQKEFDAISQKRNEANRAAADIKRQTTDLRNRRSNLDKQKSQLTVRINRIRAELANPPNDGSDIDDRISNLQDTIADLRTKIEEEKRDIPQLETRIESLNRDKKALQEEINDINDQLKTQSTDKSNTDNLYRAIKTAERDFDNEQREKDSLTSRLTQQENEFRKADAEAKSVYEKAMKHSPEREQQFKNNTRPPGQLSNLLKQEREKYEEAQKVNGLDFNQVRHQYEKMKREVQNAETYLNDLAEFIDHSEEALKMREKKLEEMKHSITRRTKISFMQYQSKRKYTGKIKFDHEQHIINIAVKQKADSEFTDVSNLSGGEKSFCLVSLLLSLWDVMECPFYCVDEFDVFMDQVNRQAATSLLVQGAQSMSTRQFIFLTPLSLDHLKNAGEDVAIFEVASTDPTQ
ncbi:RecF/RecN/SMC N terminal domain containing protein [Trichomonas vaginalis G3]|uniref:RecF/RecN/SMC N terminal domain containing protein n=1 Tax=Trichomonas vaginalis (strain ATCC PRA-98 / G3) TaxID=412133 RepID=A2FTH1_TRIV3|nr:Rad18/SMC6-like protein [Trichomonas vaginalis G3]EAX91789.1 RecF/RecN/SMC N terminal domain containing protein [Trichomonas vaginalis G3]KAI5549035.1 Rad18/SMC6-like protein [Trichomonas vaginalis G3]|eukprot:XP_001304719.1 RecF/RecN/SMC N terminal domain containing protein [Trichomonas vaginalis G3]